MILQKLTYKTTDGAVLHKTEAHPHSMPWVGQRPIFPGAPGPLVVEKVYGDRTGYVVEVGAL